MVVVVVFVIFPLVGVSVRACGIELGASFATALLLAQLLALFA
jgi:hypothetical protein